MEFARDFWVPTVDALLVAPTGLVELTPVNDIAPRSPVVAPQPPVKSKVAVRFAVPALILLLSNV